MNRINETLTAVAGLRVGHAHDAEALTGCTVILCEAGAVGGVDQRGGAPGTRETDLLRPMHLVEQVHAIVLAGGSAFGLDAASGVMRYLAGRGVGFETPVARVPIVAAAVLFDLGIGRADVRPDAEMGYEACLQATDAPVVQGRVGVGIGATAGKIAGMAHATRTGLGSVSVTLDNGLVVGALAAVNPFGDVVDPATGQIVAGVQPPAAGRSGDTLALMQLAANSAVGPAVGSTPFAHNTVIGVVATNARLSKEQVNKVAQMAHDGLARSIRPAHTMFDGDTIFALAAGDMAADVNLVGALAAEVFAQAVVAGARNQASQLPMR
ncbi:P1 family peptidase [Candidatus Amarolinea aalborgensis]|uniref:P1 family peptidase n=1 Tax=Candidatus Amarolinea aalborgensis TaxID=2249329 RepID=UPI003BF9E17D